MKVFLPKGQPELPKPHSDFSRGFPTRGHGGPPQTGPGAFSWTVHHVRAQILRPDRGNWCFERSAFWKEPVYVSHAGQTRS